MPLRDLRIAVLLTLKSLVPQGFQPALAALTMQAGCLRYMIVTTLRCRAKWSALPAVITPPSEWTHDRRHQQEQQPTRHADGTAWPRSRTTTGILRRRGRFVVARRFLSRRRAVVVSISVGIGIVVRRYRRFFARVRSTDGKRGQVVHDRPDTLTLKVDAVVAHVFGEWRIPNVIGAGRHPDRKSTRLNSSHTDISRMPSSA